MNSFLLALHFAAQQHSQQYADLLLGLPINETVFADSAAIISTIEGLYGMSLDEIINVVKHQIESQVAYEQSVLQAHRVDHDSRMRINEYLERASRFMEAEQARLEALELHAQYQKSLAESLLLKLELMLREREATYYSTSKIAELLQERRALMEREAALDAEVQEKESQLADFHALGPEVQELAIRHQMLKEALTN